jgi:hypothetical protein
MGLGKLLAGQLLGRQLRKDICLLGDLLDRTVTRRTIAHRTLAHKNTSMLIHE